jgi:hypothetical protein
MLIADQPAITYMNLIPKKRPVSGTRKKWAITIGSWMVLMIQMWE